MKTRRDNEFLKANISFTRALMHDTDKLIITLFFGCTIADSFHRFAGHHKRNKMNYKEKVEAWNDWESARFTKPDKPLNAEETLKEYYPYLDMQDIPAKFKDSQIKK